MDDGLGVWQTTRVWSNAHRALAPFFFIAIGARAIPNIQRSPKAPERPDQRPPERQHEGWRYQCQKDAVLNSGTLFLVHH